MKKQYVFNWEIFKQKGFEFQDMCADIFRYHKYEVHVMQQGGDDRGRDIEVYKNNPVDLVDSRSKELLAWVECKSNVTSSSISLSDVRVNFIYAVKEKITYLIFITNNKFTNPARNLFLSYNNDPDIRIKIRTIERDELETILKSTPEVYLKYFDQKGKQEDYETIDVLPGILSNVAANSKFADEFIGFKISLKSLGFTEMRVNIHTGGAAPDDISLGPLEEREIFIKAEPGQFAVPKVDIFGGRYRVNLTSDVPDNLHYKIDHLFVDPFHLVEKIISELRYHKHLYVAAPGGMGKTRLLKEVCKSFQQQPVSIDVSADYNKSFLDHILTKLLRIEKEYLTLLPDENIKEYLAGKSIDEESIPVFLSYLKGKSEINYDLIINFVTDLFLSTFKNDIVLIDNIHNFSILDFRLFKSILDNNRSVRIISTARDQEITEGHLKLYLETLIRSKSILVFDLGAYDAAVVLKTFIEQVSSDQGTLDFLKKYQAVPTFQQFVVILKNLRAKGLLIQSSLGKMTIDAASKSLDHSSYALIYHDLIQTLQEKFKGYPIDQLLKKAATFGYKFPIELLDHHLENTALLDELIINEVLSIDHLNPAYLRFDHELTREIVYNSIPPLQKIGLHRQVIAYLERLDTESPAFSYRQLCQHYEMVNDPIRVAEYANKEGQQLIKKSEISEAALYFEKSLNYIRTYQEQTQLDAYLLEASSLEWLIRANSRLGNYKESYNLIRSLHVLTHLIQGTHYEGLVYYHFARYYFDLLDDTVTAINYINKAILYFKDKEKLEYGRALNFKGVIEKNLGQYDGALSLHEEAVNVFQAIDDWEGLSDAYVDMGAVYLEKGEGHETMAWWLKSLQTIKKTSNLAQICERLIDYSYILAMYDDDQVLVRSELENAVFMAKRLKIIPEISRSLINYANFLFKAKIDLGLAKSTIEEAIRLTKDNELEYLGLLSRFSYQMFRTTDESFFPDDHTDRIVNYILKNNFATSLTEDLGDNRVTNMIKFFIFKRNEAILNVTRETTNPMFKKFKDQLLFTTLDEIERNNPYYMNNIYLTYY